jgi:hypothetical protein
LPGNDKPKEIEMSHAFQSQARRTGIALAALATLMVAGTGSAQAQTFTRAEIGLDRLGALTCTFRETGLPAFAQVSYSCGALAVGAVTQCFYRNKPVGNSAPVLTIFKNVSNAGHGGEVEALIARSNGLISGTVTAELPESHGGTEQCLEPAVATVTAIRWCNASLVDTTYSIPGATVAELFMQVERLGSGTVPSCTDLLNSP